MKAEDLIGVPAIRRRAIIVSEDGKIADTDYMDPNKPVIIKKYDCENNRIVLITHTGVHTILGKEYDDNSWISVKEKKPKDITIPAGYRSLAAVMYSISKARKDGKLKEVDPKKVDNPYANTKGKVYYPATIPECIHLLNKAFTGRETIDVGYNCKNYKFYDDDKPTDISKIYNIDFVQGDKTIGNSYYDICEYNMDEPVSPEKVDILIEDYIDFGNAMECILNCDREAVISTLDWIELSLECHFGFESIRCAHDFDLGDTAVLVTLFGTYKAKFGRDTVTIYRPDASEIYDMYFSNKPLPPSIMIQYDESVELHNRMEEHGDRYTDTYDAF